MAVARRGLWRCAGVIVGLVLLAGCSGPELCRSEVGPETVNIDADAFANTGPDIEVCFTIADGPETYCSEPGTSRVSRTAHSDYPQGVPYFVRITTGSARPTPRVGAAPIK